MKKKSDFKTEKEFFNYLVTNQDKLISAKKSALKFSEPILLEVMEGPVTKGEGTEHKDDLTRGKITRTIIGNTYNWMDNHDDVHLDNIFSKSISERHDKIWHLHDHEQKITSKVGKPISIYEKTVAWKDLGVNKEGNTMALFMDSNIIKEYNKMVYDHYMNKEINQHSVAMYYDKIELALNDPEAKEAFATWQKSIHLLGNREKAMQQGFFWAVSEARLVEISAVLAGSNELTPTLDNKEDVEEEGAEVKEEASFFTKFAQELSTTFFKS